MRKQEAPKGASVVEKVFFIPDLHCPYEDKRAVELMFDAMKVFKPDVVVIIGDFIDCFSVSRWAKDPKRAHTLKQEADAGKAYLDRITAKKKIYIAGNHEDRLSRYIKENASALIDFVDIPSLLDLKARGWSYVPYKSSTTIGKVHLTHDVGSAGRYNVYKALDTFQSSVVTGHTHRLGYVVEGDALGSQQVSAQFGWLGDVRQIDYLHSINAKRNWALGFGLGYHQIKTGYVHLVPVPVVNYTVAIEGKVLSR
jgi:predicted phosphodiesterase